MYVCNYICMYVCMLIYFPFLFVNFVFVCRVFVTGLFFVFFFQLEASLTAVAAAEKLDVSLTALRALAQFHMGDLRACLFTLQVMMMTSLMLLLVFGARR